MWGGYVSLCFVWKVDRRQNWKIDIFLVPTEIFYILVDIFTVYNPPPIRSKKQIIDYDPDKIYTNLHILRFYMVTKVTCMVSPNEKIYNQVKNAPTKYQTYLFISKAIYETKGCIKFTFFREVGKESQFIQFKLCFASWLIMSIKEHFLAAGIPPLFSLKIFVSWRKLKKWRLLFSGSVKMISFCVTRARWSALHLYQNSWSHHKLQRLYISTSSCLLHSSTHSSWLLFVIQALCMYE